MCVLGYGFSIIQISFDNIHEFCIAYYFIHDYNFIIKFNIFMLVCSLPVILLHYYCSIILNKLN